MDTDTLDLQDHEAPSAKDHSGHHGHGDRLGEGPAAPHQDASLRKMERERHAEQDYMADAWGSGRSSHEGSELLDEDSEFMSDGNVRQEHRREDMSMHNSDGTNGTNEEGEGGADNEEDETLIDDMVDKISSSPSIDDSGGSSALSPLSDEELWRLDGLNQCRVARSSSYHSPLKRSERHHHLGRKYFALETNHDEDSSEHSGSEHSSDSTNDLESLLEDLQLDGSSDSRRDTASAGILFTTMKHSSGSPRHIEIVPRANAVTKMQPLHASSNDHSNVKYQDLDDDLADFDFPSDPRMIDSGWSGECLRETEDIDFEFVYALPTFVATVEGQANATKGDTMVLLDDSNSYWWLVRVAKDNSIGWSSI